MSNYRTKTSIRTVSCCGVKDIHGLHYRGITAKDFVLDVGYQRFLTKNHRCGLYLYTGTTGYWKRARAVKNLIEENDLGTVVESDAAVNPNTRHKVRMYSWAVNNDKFQEWFEENKKENMTTYNWNRSREIFNYF
jgi:hypothetical protein